jgi:hypothetical protein
MKLQLASLSLVLLIASCTPTTSNNSSNPTNSPTSTPEVTTTTANSSARSGNFVAGEHPTDGRVSVVTENGKSYIEFDGAFKTDKGPDLFVVLHRSKDVLKASKPPSYPIQEGDYVNIAPLQNINGTQRYAVPENVKVSDYNSVAIWCKQFNVTFGTAALGS